MERSENPLDTLIGYQMRRASAAAMAELASELGELGLTPTEASVLLVIAANPGIRQSELGRMLGIQRANMAPLTASLDRAGLVQRERVDGRSHGLAVTCQGATQAQLARQLMDRHDARLLSCLPTAARPGFVAALLAMAATFSDPR